MKNHTLTLTSGPISAVITVTGSFTSDEVWNASFDKITGPGGVDIPNPDGFNDVEITGTKEDARRALHSMLDEFAANYGG